MDDRTSEPQPDDALAQTTPVHTGVVVTPAPRQLRAGRTSGTMLSVRDIRVLLDAALDELDQLGDRIANAARLR